MALRRSASAIGRSLHPFTTTSRRSEEQTQSTSPSSSSGFGALQDIFATPSPLPSSSSNVSTTGFLRPVIPTLTEAGRGYDPRALPPKIDPVIDMFTNLLMKHGRKAEAQGKVAKILSMLQQASNQTPIPLLQRAITLSSPSIRIRNVRRSIKTIQTPRALDERQRTRQGIMWIFRAAEKGRKGAPRDQRIAREILGVLEGESEVFKWLEERHKQAALTRSNINFR